MKIVMLSSYFFPHIGGVEKHVWRVSQELIRKGHEVTVITLKYDSRLADFEDIGKIRVYRLPERGMIADWCWISTRRGLIKDAQVVHCHDYRVFILWYLPFRFLYPGKPVFVTFHGWEGIFPIPRRALFLRKITEFLTKGNICVGDFIPNWYGTKADFITYGGIDKAGINESTGLSESAVFIGRLERDSGILTYLDAVGILKKKYGIDIKFNIYGDGSLREKVRKTAAESRVTVILHGFVENTIGLLTRNRFAFVSGYLAILEAMLNRRLAFSVYENALKKDYLTLIPNSENMMVTVSSAEELAKEIAYYYKDPAKEVEKVENAYSFAVKQTWGKVADTYLRLWRQVILVES